LTEEAAGYSSCQARVALNAIEVLDEVPALYQAGPGGSHVRVEALVNPVALAEEVHLANPKPSPASRRFAIGTIEAF
jgi:hypothetical protein